MMRFVNLSALYRYYFVSKNAYLDGFVMSAKCLKNDFPSKLDKFVTEENGSGQLQPRTKWLDNIKDFG